jgi:hypothetical protein
MSGEPLYDTIGATYTVARRTEPRIAAQVWAALGDARTVLNVGAGAGSYEPSDRDVTAVEPSAVMRVQRPAGTSPRSLLPPSASPPGWRALGARMEPVLVPGDCADGFFEAYWRRPEAYLDEKVCRGISVWAGVGSDVEQRPCASSVRISHLVSGPSATATSSISTRQSLAFAC